MLSLHDFTDTIDIYTNERDLHRKSKIVFYFLYPHKFPSPFGRFAGILLFIFVYFAEKALQQFAIIVLNLR
jgi:hypothetical protein